MSDLIPCEHQVGGWHNGSQSRVLKDAKEGLVLKPLKLNANPTYDPTFDANAYAHKQNKDIQDTSDTVMIPAFCDELQFYQHIQKSTQPDDLSLKSLVPRFYGSRDVTTEDGSVAPHLVLEDLAKGMQWPCVVDLKFGRTFAYPGKEKPKKGKKYPTQEELGYCLTGLRVFHPHTGKVLTEFRPDACKQLNTSQVFHSLETFCQMGEDASSNLRCAIAFHLRHIHRWFLTQRTYKIRCGSILMVYDAAAIVSHTASKNTINTPQSKHISTEGQSPVPTAPKSQTVNISTETPPSVTISTETQSSANTAVKSQASENISPETKSKKSQGPKHIPADTSTNFQSNPLLSLVKVKMIDFAHVLYSFGNKDDNYIFGLENLINFFEDPDKEKV